MQKVAAYCRVSTDKEDQINSLESQKKYFREYIERNPFWELTEVYVDEGISGTSTKKRHSFNKMIADAENHMFDLIISKEISRFARNTLDSILYTRKLKELDIGVIFMNDNINTLEPDAELRLTIMSSIAQEESRKTSERVKWGQKRRMEQGVVFGRDMIGYDVRDGKLYINEKGAEIVRLVFHKFVSEGKGTHVIARELQEAGIPTATYMKQWSNVVILRMLRNEKYVGDLIQKKTYTPNYLNHEKKYNRGKEEFVVIRNHHEPIICRDLFDRTQRELERRSPSAQQKAKYSNRYCFSGKIKCGLCGSSFVSRAKKRKDGSVYKSWRCYKAANHGNHHTDKSGNEIGCNARSLNDDDLKLIMQQVVKNLLIDKQGIINNLVKIVKPLIYMESQDNKHEKLQGKINQVTLKKQRLLDLYLSQEIAKSDFHMMNTKYENEIAGLEKEKRESSQQAELQKNQDQMLKDIVMTIKGLIDSVVWDDTFYRNILDKIVVHDHNIIDVYLTLLPFKWSYMIFDLAKAKREWKAATRAQKPATAENMVRELGEGLAFHFDTDIGTEELGHLEMVGAIVYQLTRNLSIEDIKKAGFDDYFVDHTVGIYPIAASGVPFSASALAVKGDVITDLFEDMAAEQKARTTYDNILLLADDPDVRDPIKFLREREIVHFQRFGEALRIAQEKLNAKNYYAYNPEYMNKLNS